MSFQTLWPSWPSHIYQTLHLQLNTIGIPFSSNIRRGILRRVKDAFLAQCRVQKMKNVYCPQCCNMSISCLVLKFFLCLYGFLNNCFPKRINGIISEVQLYFFFSFLVLTSGKFLEALGSGIGTGSIFCLSFSLSNNVRRDQRVGLLVRPRCYLGLAGPTYGSIPAKSRHVQEPNWCRRYWTFKVTQIPMRFFTHVTMILFFFVL